MDDGKVETFDRDAVLEMLSGSLAKIKEKAYSGKVKDEKNEKVRISWHRTLIHGCLTYNTILKDKQIDVMMKDIKAIKETVTMQDIPDSTELSKKDLEVVENTLAKIEES